MKRLYKSRKEKMIDGVCGGIAEYANVDPTIIRLIFFLLIFAGGAGIILYLIAMIIMPRKPFEETEKTEEETVKEVTEEENRKVVSPESSKIILAAIIIIIGIFLLLNAFLPAGWFSLSWKILLGVVLVAGGGIIIYKSFEKE